MAQNLSSPTPILILIIAGPKLPSPYQSSGPTPFLIHLAQSFNPFTYSIRPNHLKLPSPHHYGPTPLLLPPAHNPLSPTPPARLPQRRLLPSSSPSAVPKIRPTFSKLTGHHQLHPRRGPLLRQPFWSPVCHSPSPLYHLSNLLTSHPDGRPTMSGVRSLTGGPSFDLPRRADSPANLHSSPSLCGTNQMQQQSLPRRHFTIAGELLSFQVRHGHRSLPLPTRCLPSQSSFKFSHDVSLPLLLAWRRHGPKGSTT